MVLGTRGGKWPNMDLWHDWFTMRTGFFCGEYSPILYSMTYTQLLTQTPNTGGRTGSYARHLVHTYIVYVRTLVRKLCTLLYMGPLSMEYTRVCILS